MKMLVVHELKKNSATCVLYLIKSYEAEPPGRRLITCWCPAHEQFRLGKVGVWREELVPQKKSPCQEVISERILGRSWRSGRRMEMGAGGPWSLMPEAGSREQQHSRTWPSFLPKHPLPAGGAGGPGGSVCRRC